MSQSKINIKVCGKEDAEMSAEVFDAVESRIKQRLYSTEDVDYIRKLKLKLIEGGLDVSDKELEKLRSLCKLWDVELKPAEITSHRPIVGHFIVAIKKMLFPIIRVFLRDSFKQQRDFNAAAVSMLADLLNKKNKADA